MILTVFEINDQIYIYIALALFIGSLLLITTERLPNSVAAMLGAFLMVSLQIETQQEAIDAIDFDTIGLLCGMMLMVAILRKTGLFEYIAIKGVKLTKGDPWRLLVVLSIVTAVLSAFLDNVTTVLIIVPLTFAVGDTIRINILPLLISEILFSNIGGAATLIGDPPNIMIGGATDLNFMDFVIVNMPIVIIVSAVTFLLLRLIYYKKLKISTSNNERILQFDENRAITSRKLLIQSLVVFLVVIGMFMTHGLHHISLATLALGGAFFMMMVTKESPEEILREVEWPTLFFFIGLFVIIGGLEQTGIIRIIASNMIEFTNGDMAFATQLVLWVSGISTILINSIPYTATMISVIHEMNTVMQSSNDSLWWALSLGACLGGNGSLIGAAANIIVAGFTQKTKTPLSFMAYIKVGLPLMFVSLLLVSLYLSILF